MAVPVMGSIIVMCGLLLIGITAYLGKASNASEIVQEQRRLENAFDQGIANVLDQQRGVAWWDDAVVHIANAFDEGFVTSEFGIFLTETYRHDSILLLDAGDRPVFSFEGGEVQSEARVRDILSQVRPVIGALRERSRGALLPRPDNFAARQSGYQQLKGMEATASWSGAILRVDGKPSIVAAITISPNTDATLLTGKPFVLLSVVSIDQLFLDNVSRDLLLPDLRLMPQLEAKGADASMPFVADDGTPLGQLVWTAAAPGQPVLDTVLPLVISLVVAIGIFSLLVLKRLSRASQELEIRAETAQRDALLDPLSDLPNRHAFSLKAEAVLAAAIGEFRRSVIVGYLDIDRFKDINDTLGHQMGDRLISALARRLRSRLGETDFLARIGGDEFAIIRVDDGGSSAADLERTIAEAIATPIDVEGVALNVSVSLGLAVMPGDGHTIDVLMRHADIALYEAKRQGRDRAVRFTQAMGQQFAERRELELALEGAVVRGELELVFQPIVREDNGRIESAEALLRWAHPTKGMVSPAVFIPIAEEAGLMPSIGEWVLRTAIRQASQWPDMDLSINLSPIQFRHRDLVALILGMAGEHGVEPRRLTLEITEGLLLDSTPQTRRTLAGLREAGFKVALDDFGTGFSSLNYLTTFQFDKLKIDQCFVRNIDDGLSAQAIVQSVVQMSHALGMEVVAEGVETEGERAILRGFGCDHIQGYLVARPLAAAGFIAFAASYNAAARTRAASATRLLPDRTSHGA